MSFTQGNSSSTFQEDWISGKLSTFFSWWAPFKGAEHSVTLISPQYLQLDLFKEGDGDGKLDDSKPSIESSVKSIDMTWPNSGWSFFLRRRGANLKTNSLSINLQATWPFTTVT